MTPENAPVKIRVLTSAEYHKIRESLGSQRDIAQQLGVDIRTVQRREAGEIVITFEATRALYCLCAIRMINDMIVPNHIREVLDDVITVLEAAH